MSASASRFICWRVPTKFNPYQSCFHHIVVVKPQCDYRRATCRCPSNHVSATIDPSKLVSPSLRSGIEQGFKLTRFRIDRIGFRTLELVAAIAGCCQIPTIVASSLRAWQNVFHDQRCPSQARWRFAILAAIACFLSDLPSQTV